MRKLHRVSGVCLLMTFGCSTTSTIMRINEPPIEATIVGGSRDSIFVSDGGSEHEIPRSDIRDVDYPGNVHAGVGAGVLAYGVANIAVGLPQCNDQTENQAAYCTGVFLPAIIGASLIIWGLVVHSGQTSAFDDRSRQSRLHESRPEFQTRKRPSNLEGTPTAADDATDDDDDSDDDDDTPIRPRVATPKPAASDAAPAVSPSAAPTPAPSAAPQVPTASYPELPATEGSAKDAKPSKAVPSKGTKP